MDSSIVNSDLYRLNLNKAKLKGVTRTSTLFSGFAMVALVEMTIEINNDLNSDIPDLVLHGFTIITCSLIGVHLLALMISTCLLPQIETICQHYEMFAPSFSSSSSLLYAKNEQNLDNSKNVVVIDMLEDRQQQQQQQQQQQPNGFRPHLARASTAELRSPTPLPPSFEGSNVSSVAAVGPKKSLKYDHIFKHTLPLEKFQFYIELSWLLSNGVGIFLFLMQVAVVCYVKFSPMKNSSKVYVSGCVIVAIILVIFMLFTYRFYVLMVEYKLLHRKGDLENMENDIKKLANLSVDKKKFEFLNKRRFAGIFQRNNNDFTINNNKVSPEDDTNLQMSHLDHKFESISLFNNFKEKARNSKRNRTNSVS